MGKREFYLFSGTYWRGIFGGPLRPEPCETVGAKNYSRYTR